jgi:phosphoserine phosphatase
MGKPQLQSAAIFSDFDKTQTEEDEQAPIIRKYSRVLKAKRKVHNMEEYWLACDKSDFGVGWMVQFLSDRELFGNLSNEAMEREFSPQIRLSPGLPEWHGSIKKYAESKGIRMGHHIISSGAVPLIRGTAIGPVVDSIYAGEFNEVEGVGITGIKRAVDPYRKVRRIKSVCKGGVPRGEELAGWDLKDEALYEDLPIKKYATRYDRCFVLGDGLSDKDMFRFILQRGGFPIAVFEKGDMVAFDKAVRNLGPSVMAIVPRDYSKGSVLDKVVKEYIDFMVDRAAHCDMDPDIVHNYRLGQILNGEIKRVVKTHLEGSKEESEGVPAADGCKYCKAMDEKRFYRS